MELGVKGMGSEERQSKSGKFKEAAEAAELVRQSASLLYDDIEDEEVDRVYEQKLLSLRRRGAGEHPMD
jgi:hypothetical protein